VGEGAKNYQVAFSKAKGIIGNNNTDDINDYLRNRLDITNPEQVMNEGIYDPKLIAEAMQMKTQRDGLSKYSNKNAEPEDVAYYKEQGIDITEGERIYYEESNPSEVFNQTDKTYTKTQVLNSDKVNKSWNKNKPVLKNIFNSFTGGGQKLPPVKTVMANFAQANISAIPLYGEGGEELIGFELKNQLVTTKPSTILLGESKESIDQAIKVASGLSFSIGSQWESLQPDAFSMFEE
jgi:cobalamin biosynthesis Mg chelatase CobN